MTTAVLPSEIEQGAPFALPLSPLGERGPGGEGLPLLRLLQISDSSFPAGGFAFSHGLEWLSAQQLVRDERDVAGVLSAYITQVGGGQWLPAAHAAHQAGTAGRAIATDFALDASMSSANERSASATMGERLLIGTVDAFGGDRATAHLAAIRAAAAPGHYPVAFGLVARDSGVDTAAALASLGFTMIGSITQAALRLGIIGQAAASRLAAASSGTLAAVVDRVMLQRPRHTFGSFAPGLEVAALRQPSLPFRMFAS